MKATITVLPGNVLYTQWHKGPIVLHEVKEIMEEMLLYLQQYPIKKYIDDISTCEVDWPEADQWIIHDWYPRALQLGVTKNALIVAKGVNMAHVDEQCEIKSFNTLKEATAWIYL